MLPDMLADSSYAHGLGTGRKLAGPRWQFLWVRSRKNRSAPYLLAKAEAEPFFRSGRCNY